MTASGRWIEAIDEACSEADPVRANHRITQLHFLLSEALAGALGREGGPNFHSWAVWGSRKAGVTIRQEDLDEAIGNATTVAGVVGSGVGAAVGLIVHGWLPSIPGSFAAAGGAVMGTLSGGWTGRCLAIWSRAKAAGLVLEGNRTVLQDIGAQSARFLELLKNGATAEGRSAFFAGLRPRRVSSIGSSASGVFCLQ